LKAVEIRTTIRQTAYLATTEQPIRLAASFGVATYPTTRANLRPSSALADQALFAVKRSGRDGIAVGAERKRSSSVR
jgi:GGDEF domain-containing protein